MSKQLVPILESVDCPKGQEMTVGRFMAEAEVFPYSYEFFEVNKQIAQFTLLEMVLEANDFIMENSTLATEQLGMITRVFAEAGEEGDKVSDPVATGMKEKLVAGTKSVLKKILRWILAPLRILKTGVEWAINKWTTRHDGKGEGEIEVSALIYNVDEVISGLNGILTGLEAAEGTTMLAGQNASSKSSKWLLKIQRLIDQKTKSVSLRELKSILTKVTAEDTKIQERIKNLQEKFNKPSGVKALGNLTKASQLLVSETKTAITELQKAVRGLGSAKTESTEPVTEGKKNPDVDNIKEEEPDAKKEKKPAVRGNEDNNNATK